MIETPVGMFLSNSTKYYEYDGYIGLLGDNVTTNSSYDQSVAPSTLWTELVVMGQLVTVILGFVSNMATAITLWVNGDAFSTTALLVLFRHQSVADAGVCFTTALLILIPPTWLTGLYYLDLLICHVWHSTYVYGIFLIASVWNLVFIALERYLAVVKPFHHQQLTTYIIYIMLSTSYIIILITYLPLVIIQTVLKEDGCYSVVTFQTEVDRMVMFIFSIYVFVVDYALPTSIFVVSYGAVIMTFQSRSKSQNLASSRVIDKASTELTKTAFIVTIIYIFSMASGFWNYLLGNIGVTTFDITGVLHQLGMWLCSINSLANPFIYAMLIPAFRRSVKKTFCGGCQPSA